MNILSTLLDNLNYGAIVFLMFIESTFIPFPSEIVVAPAAYHAAAGELNIVLVILFATIGADLGAIANYALAYYLGRPIIYRFVNSRWGRLCLLNTEKLEKSEKYFADHGAVATLTGRMLPVIRQLISIPAGLAKMNFWKFILYTTLGAGCWNCVLATLGWYLHSIVPEEQLNNKINEYGEYIKWVTISIFVVAVLIYAIVRHYKKRNKMHNKSCTKEDVVTIHR